MKTEPSSVARSKLLSDEFDRFVQLVCTLSPKVGVESYQPIGESGEAVFFVPVRSPMCADTVFDPTKGRWIHCEMLASDYMQFSLDYTGTRRRLYPVAEAGNLMDFHLPIKSAASVSEVLEFYFDALKHSQASIEPTTKQLSELVDRAFVVVWIDRSPRLLPLDNASIGQQLPQSLLNYLTAYCRNDLDEVMRLGGVFWSDLCKEYEKQLRHLFLGSPEVNDLIGSTSDLRFGSSASLQTSPVEVLIGGYPQIVLRVNRTMSSQLFCEELFRNITEGVVALRNCFRGANGLSDLHQLLARSKVVVPDSRMGQIRYAMELRATRHAVRKKFDGLIETPRPIADAVRVGRGFLRNLEDSSIGL